MKNDFVRIVKEDGDIIQFSLSNIYSFKFIKLDNSSNYYGCFIYNSEDTIYLYEDEYNKLKEIILEHLKARYTIE